VGAIVSVRHLCVWIAPPSGLPALACWPRESVPFFLGHGGWRWGSQAAILVRSSRVGIPRVLTGADDRADFDRLRCKLFSIVVVVISSLLFRALHGGFWLAGTILSMAFAIALYGAPCAR
jgi:hypothetical protein